MEVVRLIQRSAVEKLNVVPIKDEIDVLGSDSHGINGAVIDQITCDDMTREPPFILAPSHFSRCGSELGDIKMETLILPVLHVILALACINDEAVLFKIMHRQLAQGEGIVLHAVERAEIYRKIA